jgi:hypothetical protein
LKVDADQFGAGGRRDREVQIQIAAKQSIELFLLRRDLIL